MTPFFLAFTNLHEYKDKAKYFSGIFGLNQNLIAINRKLLVSRFLTRSGDQAWDFALPLTLVFILSNRIDIVAAIYLLSKLGSVLFQPWAARFIDRAPRLRTAALGVTLQVVSLAVVTLTTFVLYKYFKLSSELNFPTQVCLFVIVLGSILTNLGSGIMEIAVGNDWVPAIVEQNHLPAFNSRMRQLDLFCEVGAPIVAGALLILSVPEIPLLGFLSIAAWNVISFVPEIYLLRSVFNSSPQLQKDFVQQNEDSKKGIFSKLFDGWSEFRKQACLPAMVAYAFLWLSVLSPHGVLLTSFLNGGWHLSEASLGLFRGLGAIFGLLATIIFPRVSRRLGLRISTGIFIAFQALMVALALVFFIFPIANGFVFLAFILLSRIGLYGFSLGEIEIRQRLIPEGVRGIINGTANSLTGLATVLLFAFGSYYSTPNTFPILIWISTVSVICGSIIYIYWAAKKSTVRYFK